MEKIDARTIWAHGGVWISRWAMYYSLAPGTRGNVLAVERHAATPPKCTFDGALQDVERDRVRVRVDLRVCVCTRCRIFILSGSPLVRGSLDWPSLDKG